MVVNSIDALKKIYDPVGYAKSMAATRKQRERIVKLMKVSIPTTYLPNSKRYVPMPKPGELSLSPLSEDTESIKSDDSSRPVSERSDKTSRAPSKMSMYQSRWEGSGEIAAKLKRPEPKKPMLSQSGVNGILRFEKPADTQSFTDPHFERSISEWKVVPPPTPAVRAILDQGDLKYVQFPRRQFYRRATHEYHLIPFSLPKPDDVNFTVVAKKRYMEHLNSLDPNQLEAIESMKKERDSRQLSGNTSHQASWPFPGETVPPPRYSHISGKEKERISYRVEPPKPKAKREKPVNPWLVHAEPEKQSFETSLQQITRKRIVDLNETDLTAQNSVILDEPGQFNQKRVSPRTAVQSATTFMDSFDWRELFTPPSKPKPTKEIKLIKEAKVISEIKIMEVKEEIKPFIENIAPHVAFKSKRIVQKSEWTSLDPIKAIKSPLPRKKKTKPIKDKGYMRKLGSDSILPPSYEYLPEHLMWKPPKDIDDPRDDSLLLNHVRPSL